MTITRAALETAIVARVGNWMTKAGMAVTTAGSNADLSDPIAWAIGALEGTVATFGAPDNTDLAAFADSDGYALLDLTEYRTLQNILGNFDKVDISSPFGGAQLDDLGQRIERRLDWLAKTIASEHGINVVATSGTISGGVLGLSFAEPETP